MSSDPRLPSLRLVALLGVFAATLIFFSGQSLTAFSTLERISEGLPNFLANSSSDDAVLSAPPVESPHFPDEHSGKTPYRYAALAAPSA